MEPGITNPMWFVRHRASTMFGQGSRKLWMPEKMLRILDSRLSNIKTIPKSNGIHAQLSR
jgi:hypothetical protein